MKYGIDRLDEFLPLFSKLRLGLICNHTSVNSEGVSSVDILKEKTDLSLLLAPEHGVRGNKAAGEAFDTERDEASGLPVVSLYREGSQSLPESSLVDIDALVYDIQDVGMRCYTYISTLYLALHFCAESGKHLLVLDRPNPLGRQIEGPILQDECRSFVGIYSLTTRYGLTCGEFARLVKLEEKLDVNLSIIPCSDYDPRLLFSDLGKAWIAPSPAITGFENAILYSAFFLLEASNISEGRGTSSPFSFMGAPFIEENRFSQAMNHAVAESGLGGIHFEPASFTPVSSKYQGELCHGVRAVLTDPGAFNGIRTGLAMLRVLSHLWPEKFKLLNAPGKSGLQMGAVKLDRLLGARLDWITAGDCAIIDENEKQFAKRAEAAMIY